MKILWALYANTTTRPARAELVPYTFSGVRAPEPFPIDQAGSPVQDFPFSRGASIEPPFSVLNISSTLRGLTFNAADNFVIVGSRPDPEDNLGVVDYFDTSCEPTTWTLNDKGELIIGPVEGIFPLSCELNGITYVESTDSYYVTDPSCGGLYETIVTCCAEVKPPNPPENRYI